MVWNGGVEVAEGKTNAVLHILAGPNLWSRLTQYLGGLVPDLTVRQAVSGSWGWTPT